MKLTVSASTPLQAKADALIVALTEKAKALPEPVAALDRKLKGAVADALRAKELTGKRNQAVAFRTNGRLPARKLVCVGLGPAKKVTLEHARQAIATAAKAARGTGAKTVAVVQATFEAAGSDVQALSAALVEGLLLSQYRFDRFKKAGKNAKALSSAALLVSKADVTAARKALKHATLVCGAVTDARDLVNLPGNELSPEKLAAYARDLAGRHDLKCTVLEGKQLEKNELAGVLAVGSGSQNTPRFIILEYAPQAGKGAKQPPLVLVGKGVTFDSGGLSLKPSQAMTDMKTDMGGASTAINTMAVVAELKPDFPVIALVPAVENMPSGTASRPGDIIRYASGQTVEIGNTDAEGRLILADALLWAKRYKPAAVIDLATLTGACIIALGEHATALLCTDDELAGRITAAGEAVFERVWRMPLWDDYEPQLESPIADMKNIGGRAAGTITAALFLRKFVKGDASAPAYPWAHLDVAGTASIEKDRPYTPKGATGVGVRLLAHLIEHWPTD